MKKFRVLEAISTWFQNQIDAQANSRKIQIDAQANSRKIQIDAQANSRKIQIDAQANSQKIMSLESYVQNVRADYDTIISNLRTDYDTTISNLRMNHVAKINDLQINHSLELIRFGSCQGNEPEYGRCLRPVRYKITRKHNEDIVVVCGVCFLSLQQHGQIKTSEDLEPPKIASYQRNSYKNETDRFRQEPTKSEVFKGTICSL